MSDTDESEEQGELAAAPAETSDWFLTLLCRFAEANVRVGATVSANGTVVSGTIISEREYFEGLKATFEAASYDGQASLQETFVDAFDDLIGALPADDDHEAKAGRKIAFLHMREARVLSGGSMIPSGQNPGTFWRARLSQVSGFHIGLLTTGSPTP